MTDDANTPPALPERWAHQEEDFLASRDLPAAALHHEPRLGKSRVAVETAAHLRGRGLIDAAVVIAPGGVHVDWAAEHVPTWYGPHAGAPEGEQVTVVSWDSLKTDTKRYRQELVDALKAPGMLWVCANVEALKPRAQGKLTRYLEKVIARRRTLWIQDEGHKIKNPRAKRTKQAIRLGQKCPFRRVLDGTPVVQGPFDLWAPYNLLDPKILGPRYTSFRARYGVFERVRYGRDAKAFDQLVEYRNLDDLKRRIAPVTFERRKADCMDLPERQVVTRRFQMPRAHARVYRDLLDEARAELDSGEVVTAAQALQKLLRLQQAARGYTQPDGAVEPVMLGGPYPAAEAAAELVDEQARLGGKTVLWARFRADLDAVEAELAERDVLTDADLRSPGDRYAIRCDGAVPQSGRAELRRRFREDPDAVAWYGTTQTGGIGVDLGVASLMIFYSHGFSLGDRLQALERNYGSSQKAERVEVVDLVAEGTVDQRALEVLRDKAELADRLSTRELADDVGWLTSLISGG